MESGFDDTSHKWFKVAKSLSTYRKCCTCPRHNKSQVYKINVKWVRKLRFLSLFEVVNGDIYHQEIVNKSARQYAKNHVNDARDKLVKTNTTQV
jgi:hypothetical protein